MNVSEKRPNKWWTETDTISMLTLIEQLDLVRELDKKRQRNELHFRRLHQSLAKKGIHFTVNQIRNRWKSLKHKYRKIKLATYRSSAARLCAMESFRYFCRLDRMLACRPRSGGPEEGHRGEHSLVGQLGEEDHTNTSWPGGASLETEPEIFAPKLDSSAVEGVNTDELNSTKHSSWAADSHEIMTLGLSGEYLYTIKTEPHSDLTSAPSIKESREATDSKKTSFSGTSDDFCRLILEQLTILNHQLEEQLAEQRAFHCSMLGMMDRQIEVLEQLSSFTQSHCCQPMPEPSENESSITQKFHKTLLQILKGLKHKKRR
ncbi:uncharacterized protein si:ch211-116o3.5 [Hoplias malabaricus]|uniref:uncharacterized protein si:ch211-116o3.5 n=1 Tax=Hoplias malabaricus TaxID=27720 RepID=UPI0034629172